MYTHTHTATSTTPSKPAHALQIPLPKQHARAADQIPPPPPSLPPQTTTAASLAIKLLEGLNDKGKFSQNGCVFCQGRLGVLAHEPD